MNKLQLYITKSGNGLKSLLNLNPSEDVRRNVRDLTDALALIEYDSEEKNIFYMLSSTDEGIFFTILRTIPPQRGHHLATWIYIPCGTQITGEQLDEVIALTTRKISNPEVSNDDVAMLRDTFNREYPVDHNAPAITASARHGYAWRRYSGDSGVSLAEFAGRGRFQQAYLPYAGVLLVDANLNYNVAAPCLDDTPIGEPATILPPEKTEQGFSAYIFGRQLDRPILGTLGAPLSVVWKRPGFEDVTEEETVASAEFTPTPVATDDSHKLITPNSFYITSQVTRDQLTTCAIRVNGFDITPEGHSFTSDELHSASVVITCDGHFPFTGNLNLASTTRALVQLQEKRKVYRFEMPVISSELGAPIKFEIHTKKTLTESPLEGYALLDEMQEGSTRTNHLGYVGKSGSLLSKILYVVAGIVVGFLMAWLFGTCSGPSESRMAPAAQPADSIAADSAAATTGAAKAVAATPTTAPKAQSKPAAAAPANLNVAEAVKYLDSNKTWKKADLDKCAPGLYDDLNTFQLDKLVNTWGPQLKASKEFTKLVTHINQGRNKEKSKKNVAKGKYTDDNSITAYGWECQVDP